MELTHLDTIWTPRKSERCVESACDRLWRVASTLCFHGADIARHVIERAGELKHTRCVALFRRRMIAIANEAKTKIVLSFLR